MEFIMTGRLTFQGTRYLSFERKDIPMMVQHGSDM